METNRIGGSGARSGALLVVAALLTCVLGHADTRRAAAEEADNTVAKALLDSAEEQLRKRNHAAALALAAKTLTEAPNFLPAHEFKASVYRKLKKPTQEAEALAAWLASYEHHATAGTLDKSATRAKRSLEKRYDRLMRPSRELDELLAELRADLESVKAEHGDSAPNTADQIQILQSSLGGAPADKPTEDTEGEMSSVYQRAKPTSELDLIGESCLGNPSGVSYPETGVMLLEYKKGGTILQPIDAITAGPHYVYEMRLVPEPQSSRWLSGLVFGIEGPLERFFGAFVNEGSLLLHRVAERGRIKEDVAVKRLSVKAGEPLILTVLVEEQSIEVYVDGKKEISYTAPREHSLGGTPGIWMQDVITRAVALRLGRIK